MQRAQVTRERILVAAEEIVLRDGVARLTLEATALEAGVSKGGVLYHYAGRDALVRAMVERLTDRFDEDLSRLAAGGGPGAFTRAYLEATVAPPRNPEERRSARLGAALIAGVAADPALLAPLRERFSAWQEALVVDGVAPEIATVVRLCADGLWLDELLGLAPPDAELRVRVAEALARILRDATVRP